MMEQVDQHMCPYDPRPVDKKERKRYQNRLAQRTYRRNQKLRLRELEEAVERATQKSASPTMSEIGDATYLDPRALNDSFPLYSTTSGSQQLPRLPQQQQQQQQPQYQPRSNPLSYATMSSPFMTGFAEERSLEGLPELATPLEHPSNLYRSALHRAVCNGSEQMIRLLLKRGAGIHQQNSNGQAALHVAAEIGREDAVRVLLEAVDANAIDAFNRTALFYAVRAGNEVITKSLIQASVNVNHKDIMGETALHWAVEQGSEQLTWLLLEAGADIDA